MYKFALDIVKSSNPSDSYATFIPKKEVISAKVLKDFQL